MNQIKESIRIEIEIDVDAMKMLANAPFSEVVDYHIKAGKGSLRPSNGAALPKPTVSVASTPTVKQSGYYSIVLDAKTTGISVNRVIIVPFNSEFQDFEKRFNISNLIMQYNSNELARSALLEQRSPIFPQYEGTDLKAIRAKFNAGLIKTRTHDFRFKKVFNKLSQESVSTDP